MKGEMRKKVQAELDALEALHGTGSAAMLCNVATRLILVRSAGAPQAQGRADTLARSALAAAGDQTVAALFRQAEDAGRPAMVRKLTGADGCIGVIRAADCEEGIVLTAETVADSRQILDRADRVFGLLTTGEERAA